MKVIAFLVCAILLSIASPPEVRAECGGWWDECYCHWYTPWNCTAVPEVKAQVAQEKEYWYTNASIGLGGLAAVFSFIPGAGLAALTAAIASGVSAGLAVDQNKIKNAADNPPPTADYWSQNLPGWPSAQSVTGGNDYSGWYWIDQMIVGAQGARQMAEVVEVANGRFRACIDNGADCAQWNKDVVNWALYMHGWYLGYVADYSYVLALEIAREVPDHRGLVGLLLDLSAISDDAEERYQQ